MMQFIRYSRPKAPWRCSIANFHVAVVGSGPSGFFSSKYLLDRPDLNIRVDLMDKLPVPFGLVRYGVAPDHQDVKAVSNVFKDVAKNSNFRFFGNVSVGENNPTSISVSQLLESYDAVVLAYGASSDLSLGIPGEDLSGVFSARTFVNWYNGHPLAKKLENDYDFSRVTDVVIVGNGNVAIDCARVMAKSRMNAMSSTDVSSSALEVLKKIPLKTITILGRRGHIQASFTIKEFRELTRIPGLKVIVDSSDLNRGRNSESLKELEEARPRQRLVELIESMSNGANNNINAGDDNDEDTTVKVYVKFLYSPVAIHGDTTVSSNNGGVGAPVAMTVEKNELAGIPFNQRPRGSGEKEELPCQLVLKSVGYRSVPLDSVPFDQSSFTIPHVRGRVVNTNQNTSDFVSKLYVVGWLKRGANGVVGSNIVDAKETVQSVIEDLQQRWSNEKIHDDLDPISKIPQLQEDDVVTWQDYLRIDEEEHRRGQLAHVTKIREKLLTVEEMIEIAKKR